MDTRKEGKLVLRTPLRDFFIRDDHELFYEHMSIVSYPFFYIFRDTFLAHFEITFCDFEEDFPFFFSTFCEELIERVEICELYFFYVTFMTESNQRSRGGKGVFTRSCSILDFHIIATPNPIDALSQRHMSIDSIFFLHLLVNLIIYPPVYTLDDSLSDV